MHDQKVRVLNVLPAKAGGVDASAQPSVCFCLFFPPVFRQSALVLQWEELS